MKALYRNDTGKGPGHGFIEVSDAPDNGGLEGIRFTLKRSSDQKTLGNSGWLAAEQLLEPDGLCLTEDGFALAVGPAVVDNLDTQEVYRLQLVFADGTMSGGIMRVPEVAYSPLSGGQSISEAPALRPAPPVPEPAPEPEPEPEPAEEAAPKQEVPLPLPETKKSSSALLALLLLLLLAAGGAAVWFAMAGKEESPAVAEKAPLERAREYLSGQAQPEEGTALAKELRSLDNGADAAFLLLEDAAQKGLPEAMALTGGFYDPVDTAPSGSIRKDPAQAFAWYAKAREKGYAGAEAKLQALRAWAEAEAAKGSAEAKELLQKFS